MEIIVVAAIVGAILAWVFIIQPFIESTAESGLDRATDGITKRLVKSQSGFIALSQEAALVLRELKRAGALPDAGAFTASSGVEVKVSVGHRSGSEGLLCEWTTAKDSTDRSRPEILADALRLVRTADPSAHLR